jgi:hypothetical protein
VTKSSNHTLSFHRLTSNSSSATNFPWLYPIDNRLPYIVAARTTQHRTHKSRVILRVHWPATQHWARRRPRTKHFFQYPFYCSVHEFRALPRNGSTCYNTKHTKQLRFVECTSKTYSDFKGEEM